MRLLLHALLSTLRRLSRPVYQPLKDKCRGFLCACLDRQLKEHTVPLLNDLHLRLDNLLREQDRLLMIIENMQAAHAPATASEWGDAGGEVLPLPDDGKREVA